LGVCLTVWMGTAMVRMRGWSVVTTTRSPSFGAPNGSVGKLLTATRNLLSDLEDVAGHEAPAYVRREVWQWVRDVEAATPAAAAELSQRGLQVDSVRQRLLADGDRPSGIQAVIAMLRVFEQRLATPRGDHYRGHAGVRGPTLRSGTAAPGSDAHTKAYEQLIRVHGRGMLRVAASYTRTPSERDDLYQDIALALWRAMPRFRGEASLRTFAYRVAHNRGVTHSTRRRPTPVQADEAYLASASPSPEQNLDRATARKQLQDAVRDLPLGQRQVLTLALEGFRQTEIAEIVGITPTNVSVRLSRARKRLKKILGTTSRRASA
ncbi:MAG: RNA polymerase sigma factor, partial [Nannocystaceae bacterium]